MPMTRQQRHHMAAVARYQAGKNKPLERKRVQSYMEPITRTFNQMMTGEVDSIDGHAVTHNSNTDEWERTDRSINGVLAAFERLFPDLDLNPLRWVSSDLTKGKLMSEKKVLAAKRKLKEIEDRMTKCTWQQVTDATRTTEIEIEMENLGLKEAA